MILVVGAVAQGYRRRRILVDAFVASRFRMGIDVGETANVEACVATIAMRVDVDLPEGGAGDAKFRSIARIVTDEERRIAVVLRRTVFVDVRDVARRRAGDFCLSSVNRA